MSNREFEIVVYGATSFVGKILCQYLAAEINFPDSSWAMAGRSESKLNQVRLSLGKPHEAIRYLVADAEDEDALRDMCNKARVVLSTVGPYALYGETLVKVCAETGTDYCDLTGEPQWIRRMIDRYQATARQTGARIVHCCGFDSIPSDLGTYFLQQLAKQRLGEYCQQVKMRVKVLKGGASGGTIASMVNVFKEAARNKQLRKELADLYSLCPNSPVPRPTQRMVGMEYDVDFSSWVAPFVMAAINTRVVLRSNALLESPYGTNFCYDEGLLTGDQSAGKRRARKTAMGMTLITIAMTIPPIRWLALKFLPGPGEGPSPEEQLKGYFDLRFFGHGEQGQTIAVRVTGDRDPGYGSTAKMLAQAGLCLARDIPADETPGGFWTPATAMGENLIRRLIDHAGFTFDLLESQGNSN